MGERYVFFTKSDSPLIRLSRLCESPADVERAISSSELRPVTEVSGGAAGAFGVAFHPRPSRLETKGRQAESVANHDEPMATVHVRVANVDLRTESSRVLRSLFVQPAFETVSEPRSDTPADSDT
jgi:hypothetical protein